MRCLFLCKNSFLRPLRFRGRDTSINFRQATARLRNPIHFFFFHFFFRPYRSEIVHVWRDSNLSNDGPKHSAQMVVDGVSYLTETVCNISAQPWKAITDVVADKIAPSYWKQNSEISVSIDLCSVGGRGCSRSSSKRAANINSGHFGNFQHCYACKANFDRTGLPRHHCRGCGEGVCNACSMNEMPVPARGWTSPVRVCNACKDILSKKRDACPGNFRSLDGDVVTSKRNISQIPRRVPPNVDKIATFHFRCGVGAQFTCADVSTGHKPFWREYYMTSKKKLSFSFFVYVTCVCATDCIAISSAYTKQSHTWHTVRKHTHTYTLE